MDIRLLLPSHKVDVGASVARCLSLGRAREVLIPSPGELPLRLEDHGRVRALWRRMQRHANVRVRRTVPELGSLVAHVIPPGPQHIAAALAIRVAERWRDELAWRVASPVEDLIHSQAVACYLGFGLILVNAAPQRTDGPHLPGPWRPGEPMPDDPGPGRGAWMGNRVAAARSASSRPPWCTA